MAQPTQLALNRKNGRTEKRLRAEVLILALDFNTTEINT